MHFSYVFVRESYSLGEFVLEFALKQSALAGLWVANPAGTPSFIRANSLNQP